MGERRDDKLEVLRTLLDSAARIAAELASAADPLTARLADIVRKAPPEDLGVLLGVLEREIAAKRTADVTADAMTGLSLRPNPNARLYTRVIEREPAADRQDLLLAAIRAMRGIHRAADRQSPDWEAIAQEALRSSEPAERESIARFCRTILDLVAQLDGGPEAVATRR